MKRADFASVVDAINKHVLAARPEPVVLTRRGKPFAVVMPTEGADMESIALSLDPKFQQMLKDSDRRYYQEGGCTLEEICEMHNIPPRSKETAGRNGVKTTAGKKKPRNRR